jgi:predicted NUDIX family NTP pyrophosphohydrolase
MALISAGILLFRRTGKEIEFFLVHPGGPFFAKKNEGFWTIPKGLISGDEQLLETAKREFAEETGFELKIAIEDFIELGTVTQKGGKTVHCFATELDLDATAIKSNAFEIEWPPKSGKKQQFSEVDKAGWFALNEARRLINTAQAAFLTRILKVIE